MCVLKQRVLGVKLEGNNGTQDVKWSALHEDSRKQKKGLDNLRATSVKDQV